MQYRFIRKRHAGHRRNGRHGSQDGLAVVVSSALHLDGRLLVVDAGDPRCVIASQTLAYSGRHRAYAGFHYRRHTDGLRVRMQCRPHRRERSDPLHRCRSEQRYLASDGIDGIYEDVEVPVQYGGYRGIVDMQLQRLYVYAGIDAPGPFAGHDGLRAAHGVYGREDLTVQVAGLEDVPVDCADPSYSGSHESFEGVSSDSSVPDHYGGGFSQPFDPFFSEKQSRPLAHAFHSAILLALSKESSMSLSSRMPHDSDSLFAKSPIPVKSLGTDG